MKLGLFSFGTVCVCLCACVIHFSARKQQTEAIDGSFESPPALVGSNRQSGFFDHYFDQGESMKIGKQTDSVKLYPVIIGRYTVCLFPSNAAVKRSENWHAGVFNDANQDSGRRFAKRSIVLIRN